MTLRAVALILLFLAAAMDARAEDVSISSAVTFTNQDRVLVLAPHPDDETLGAGAAIQTAVAAKAPVKVVFLTNGNNNEWVLKPSAVRAMGDVRHDEALSACRTLGVAAKDVVFLGYPDFGMLSIFTSHWGAMEKPYRSILTKLTAVPSRDVFRPEAPHKGEEVLRDLTNIIRDFRPTKIITAHPADEMPDHRALYLFTRVAVWNLNEGASPDILPYLVHVRFRNWPSPEGYYPDDPLEPPRFFEGGIFWRRLDAPAEFVARKYEALQHHRTQFDRSGRYLSSFVRRNELFGDLPTIQASDLDGPPADVTFRPADIVKPHPQLTSQEKARFLGIEKRTLDVEGSDVVQTIRFTRPVSRAGKDVAVSVYLVGYRHDVPFEQMPKIRVRIGRRTVKVFNQSAEAIGAGVSVTRDGSEITVRCPLRGLGYPEKVMTSARTNTAGVPLDWTSWRIIEGLTRP